MNWRRSCVFGVAALVGLAGLPAFAQSVISAQSGMVHYVEGRVFLGDQSLKTKFGQFPQIGENQVLRTEEGRAEVLLNPGVFLRVGENSSLRMLSTRLTDSRLELLSGTMLIEAAELDKDSAVTVLYKDAIVSLVKNGLYRFETEPAQLRVFQGEALVEASGQRVMVKKGRLLPFDGSMVAQKFDRELTDSLDRWSGRRAEYLAMANVYAARSIEDSGVFWGRSGWGWNPYFGMFTFIPASGAYYSPYGFRYWSPQRVYLVYEPPRRAPSYGGWGNWDSRRGYTTIRPTVSGRSGTLAVSGSAPTTSSNASSAPIARGSGQAGGRKR